jgi:hypothetical protein
MNRMSFLFPHLSGHQLHKTNRFDWLYATDVCLIIYSKADFYAIGSIGRGAVTDSSWQLK